MNDILIKIERERKAYRYHLRKVIMLSEIAIEDSMLNDQVNHKDRIESIVYQAQLAYRRYGLWKELTK